MLRTQWVDFPQMVKESLERNLVKAVAGISDIELSRFLKVSSNIGYQWMERTEVKEAILRVISNPRFMTRMRNNAALSTVIDQYLRDVGVKWDLYPDGTRQRFNDSVEPLQTSFAVPETWLPPSASKETIICVI
jgi:hypothetical protein